MQHIFDIEIAKKYDVNIAIFLNNMAFWIQKNVANQKHYHQGRYWTYNSQAAFIELFPYWSRQTIRTIINKCIKNKLIIKGNFNKYQYDQTHWYALTKLGLSLFPSLESLINTIGENQPMDGLKSTNGSARINQPIPDINTDIKTNKNICASSDALSHFSDFWIEYPIKKNRIRCERIWEKNNLNEISEIIIKQIKIIKNTEWKNIEEKFIPHPDSYLKNRRWEDEIKQTKNQKKETKSTVGFWNSDLQIKIKEGDKDIAKKSIKDIKKALSKKY